MEPVRDYELRAFFRRVVDVLEELNIPYMVVGGFAAIFYGEPRLTLDVDIVVDMQPEHVVPFVSAFPIPDYYVSTEGIYDSLERCYPFNVIQPTTGAKIDLVPLPGDPFTPAAFQRRQRMTYDEAGHTAVFITAEDIIVAKLLAYQGTRGDRHLRDARGVLFNQWEVLNFEALEQRAQETEVQDLLTIIIEAARREIGT